MTAITDPDVLLIERIRRGESDAWNEAIARFEGRLLAFVESRLGDRAASEDVVQETFIGFLTSLPNYDTRRSLEAWLFSIAAHKLADHLRRIGRRPALPLYSSASDSDRRELVGRARMASSIYRSAERQRIEEVAVARALREILDRWRARGDREKARTIELLFVCGRANKQAAAMLGISEQAVANHKHEFLTKMRAALAAQKLSKDIFPELAEA